MVAQRAPQSRVCVATTRGAMAGYFSVERDLLSHDLWLDEPFTRGQAWIDLIGLANYTDGWIRVADQRIDLVRGQCGWSETKLSERWKWSRGKVRRFLSELEIDQRISRETNTRTTIVTICNYEIYQNHGTAGDTTDSTTDGHQTVQQTDTNKKKEEERKKEKNKESPTPYPEWLPVELFLAFKEMRKGKRKHLTEKAEQLAIEKLDNLRKEGHSPKAVLEQSILHSWDGLFPIKPTILKGPAHGSHTGFAKQDYRAGTEGFDVT